MNSTQAITPATAALIDYIMNMPPEQAEKAVSRLSMVKKLLNMTDNQCLFTETFTDKVFGNLLKTEPVTPCNVTVTQKSRHQCCER